MNILALREHKPTFAVPLEPAVVDALRGLGGPGAELEIQPTRGRPGHYDVTAGGQVGVIRVAGLTVSIAPKLPLDKVLFLISYAMDGRWWRDDEVALPEDADLVEALVPFYARAVQRALRPGVLQGYQTREEALPLVRGRLRVEDQIRRRHGRMFPVEVRYDDFTVDIEANRVLLAAARSLQRLPLRSLLARRQLRGIEAALEGVSEVRYDARQLPAVTLDRLGAHYRPAVDLACLILRGASWEVGHGRVAARGCLINMNEVFEAFVVRSLREHLGLSERDLRQGERIWLDVGGRVAVRPDLGWWHGGRPIFVGDVKYKRLTTDLARHADIYQALAYSVATDLPGATLIYAAGESEPARYRVANVDKVIDVVALDLSGSINKLRSEVGRVAGIVAKSAEIVESSAGMVASSEGLRMPIGHRA